MALWCTGLLLLLLWFSGTRRWDWRMALGCVAVLAAGLALYQSWRRAPSGQLSWDGGTWHWERTNDQTRSGVQVLSVVADFQHYLVLLIGNDAGARQWICAERCAFPGRWLDFRRAVYCVQKTAHTPSQIDPVPAGRVPAVAVSSHVQAGSAMQVEP